MEQAVARLIVTWPEQTLPSPAAPAPAAAPLAAARTGFHPLTALKKLVVSAEQKAAAAIADIGDNRIVKALPRLLRFLGQAGYQRVTAYLQLLEVTGFADRMMAIRRSITIQR